MDHRCLYGHRVPASFTFAIERRLCPTCGAATVSLDGYQLARRLATEVPLQAVDAFNTVLFLQKAFKLTPLDAAPEAVGEVLDVETGEQPAAQAPPTPRVRPAGAREEIPDHPTLARADTSEPIAADEVDDDASAEELAFFSI